VSAHKPTLDTRRVEKVLQLDQTKKFTFNEKMSVERPVHLL